jgi:hypothetical protein
MPDERTQEPPDDPESELVLEFAHEESFEAPPAAASTPVRIKVGASSIRCPYCHADIDAKSVVWVACQGCLARHHAACWRESKKCATCGEKKALKPAGHRTPSGTRASAYLAARDAEIRSHAPESRRDPYAALVGLTLIGGLMASTLVFESGRSTISVKTTLSGIWFAVVAVTILFLSFRRREQKRLPPRRR